MSYLQHFLRRCVRLERMCALGEPEDERPRVHTVVQTVAVGEAGAADLTPHGTLREGQGKIFRQF